ncbi:aminodeoxychorismate lyase [Salipaludibacillus sp. CUR1]|uniref:aminodeoxychorismate lyase n=1 Tax=Salipaludibacillus sp. CUR1 TaxID=2820003 RepID=UPI001E5B694B|nr:aminodeoxychorismate lyase [Salipaludibacillus sp. CUR1]MCE7791279.1 aminodeoxychorismate lyase [Salipaludibacillus sp. CUR1]
MYLYVNGSFMKEEDVRLSPFDHGFLYGLGLFETFRTYEGHPFLLDDHFQRLHESAEEMNIKLPPYSRLRTSVIIKELLRLNGLNDGYFRWNISAGERGIGLTTETYEEPVTIVYVKPLPKSMPDTKKASTLTLRRNNPEGAYRLKSHHYLNNILGKRELGNDPGEEGIFLTENSCLSEGIVSNLFWLKNGEMYTPDLTCGCLNGITRQFVLASAVKEQISVNEGRFSLDEALQADEVFVTNAIQEAVAVNEWDGQLFPGRDGAFYKQIKEKFNKYTPGLWTRNELN